MAALVWDQPGEREFETGVSHGVLYSPDGWGVVWNGLTAVTESTNDSVDPVYFDGIKVNELVTLGDFSAVLRAYTYPDEFQEFEGLLEDQTGVFITGQPKSRFHLSYQTKVGDDILGVDSGYKIHLLYNLTAIPSSRTYTTLSSSTDPMEFEWELTGIPEEIPGFRPTVHVILDSRALDEWLLEDLSAILYGDETHTPRLPPLKELTTFIRNWDRVIIIDNGDGTWTASSIREGFIEMLDATTFQLNNVNAVYLDADTYEVSSSEKNEDNIWVP